MPYAQLLDAQGSAKLDHLLRRAFLRLLIYGLFLVGRDLSQNFGAVNIGIDLLPYLDDLAFGRDEEGFAVGERHRAKVLDRDTVSLNDLMVGVGEELYEAFSRSLVSDAVSL